MGDGGRLEGRVTVPAGGWTATVTGTATIAAGTYYASTFLAAVGTAFATASGTTCTATASLGEGGTGLVTLTFGAARAVTWISTDLRDILGFTGNLSSGTSHVSTQHMRSVWLPGCSYQAPNVISNYFQGTREADLRSAGNRAGYSWSHLGQEKVVTWLAWPQVKRHKVWIENESTVNASFERWSRDVAWGSAAWGTAGGPVRFYPDADSASTYATYWVVDAANIRPSPLHDDWAGGPWTVRLARLVQVPGTAYVEPERRFPANSAEWSEWFPTIVAARGAPTSAWTCQSTASPLEDVIAANDLTGTGATPLYLQSGDPLGRYSVGFSSGAARFQAASAAVLDIALQNVTVLARCYVPSGSANLSPIIRRRNSAGSSNGLSLGVTGSSAYRGAVTFDGGVASPAELNIPHVNTWLDLVAVLDRTGSQVRLYSTLGTQVEALNPSTGSLTNATDIFALGDANGITSEPGMLISYAAIWIGAAFDATDYAAWTTPV